MSRISASILLLAIVVCMLATAVSADRLITIPTGTTLTTGQIKLEYDAKADDSASKIYWVNVGVSRIELEGARFDDSGRNDAISAQVAVLPETSFTPAVAVGVRDISDKTDDKGFLYDGASYYLSVSKAVPLSGGLPLIFHDVKAHGGIGTGSLKGVFFGIEGSIPMGLHISTEYDTSNVNYALDYNVIPTLKLKLSWIKSDLYYGAKFATKF